MSELTNLEAWFEDHGATRILTVGYRANQYYSNLEDRHWTAISSKTAGGYWTLAGMVGWCAEVDPYD